MFRKNFLPFKSHLRRAALIALMLLALSTLAMQTVLAQTFTVLYQFSGTPDGANPMGSVIRNNVGTLYGTTYTGGAGNVGAIFKLSPYGQESILHSLTTNDGMYPTAGLVGDPQGNLYGVTQTGGPIIFYGTVFKVDKYGNLTMLLNFLGDVSGGGPEARLLRDSEGNLYGATDVGGFTPCPLNGCGLVYKLDPSGKETILHDFTGAPDGWMGNDLFRDAKGNLYGTTVAGGLTTSACYMGSCGLIYKLDTANNETVLYRFTGGTDGGAPHSGLACDAAGNFYGTTYSGGAYGYGVVFKLDPRGNLTVLHHFTGGWDGANPHGGLVWSSDGKLYGTSVNGGAYNSGVVFRLTKTGTFTVLHSLNGGTDGAHPYATLFRGPGNAMYGTAADGGITSGACGTTGCGTVFVVTP
jgi:uncharacterized repeat protein (TIGR03803 family)